jgi:hypothetical protein
MTHEEIAAAVADVIQDHVALALAPVMTRLTIAETQVAEMASQKSAMADLRDRVVVVETKAAVSVVVPPVVTESLVDLSPMLERLAAAETRIETLGDLRDRVVVMETKATIAPEPIKPEPVDLSLLFNQLAVLEKRVTDDMKASEHHDEGLQQQITKVVERVSSVEARTPTHELWDGMKANAVEIRERLKSLEPVATELSALRERVAVAEVRQLVPGPAGQDGVSGKDGRDGKDGVDGLGYDDLGIDQQPDLRSVKFLAKRGLQVKELGTLTFPVEIYRGVYQDGKSYDRGDCTTWGGSEWHCNETTTTKPGDGSKAWTLKVKRGRDGKDGRDAMDSVPVVSIGKR